MAWRIQRRQVLIGAAAVSLCGGAVHRAVAGAAKSDTLSEKISDIERRNGGRLGVSILDLQTQARFGHRENERFAMCSTFKFLAASCVLSRVDRGLEHLDRRIKYEAKDLVSYSPATKDHVADGLTMAEVCEAAVTLSDNTAGNLMLASFGGPSGWTAFVRSLGDDVSRLDRIEPYLNDWTPGDERDTTTPAAMADNLRKVVLGDVLSKASRDRITAWLVACKTGQQRLRAGFPSKWKVGDKTGSSRSGIANDIAVAWPPDRAPLIVACYFSGATIADGQRNAAIAEVGAAAATLVR
ncbi:MAG: class A beta-lactamase [Alphaproteobacteria bacterium]|nr:class A beta-lactamase [Alphaproteobacteria bacterium]